MSLRRVPVVLRSSTLALRQRRTLPQTLVLFVTSRCNARCDFCLYKDSVDNPTRRSEELTVAEVGRIAEAYGPLHYLALSGGEPFVRRDIGELCQAFVDRCGTSVVDIPSNFAYGDVMVSTAGAFVEANPGVVVELQLSIDHIGERHDESRGVPGLYETAIDTFRRLEAVREDHPNLSLKVNVVWLERNKDDIDEIAAELRRRISFDRIHLTYPHHRIPSAGAPSPDAVADFDRFRGPAEALANDARSRFDPFSIPMRAAKVSSHRLLREALTGEVAMGEVCEAGRHLVVVDEKGEVFPCETIWESVGNLRDHDYDLAAVLAGERYQAFRDEHLGPDRCNCTWSCAAMTAVSVDPARYPRMAGDAVRVALGRPAAP
jgi:radical SAM protein with 4Fe4S-binding SPASM domain